ncbi:MAG: hypothetical protein KIT09_35475, partial [Bryobacteraceae bacterium]|nr:hypothetical protein [Bryobacteraceae bacterium]
PVDPGPAPQKSETNPPPLAAKAAAAASKSETNPTIAEFPLKWDSSSLPYLPTADEFDRIIAGVKDDSWFLKKK